MNQQHMGRRLPGWIILIGICWLGCSTVPPPGDSTWTAVPAFDVADQQGVQVRFEPIQNEVTFFASFLLTVANGGDRDLTIDWNATRYLFNGQAQGGFVFAGIDPQAIHTAAIPGDTIAAGTVFTREIMPQRLIAWRPIRTKTAATPSIFPGILPAGENGIRLVVRRGDEEVTIPLSVRLQQS
jgi:hypothetical protein